MNSPSVPTDWTVLTLSDVAKMGSGGTPKSGNPDFYGGDIPWAVIGDLNDGLIVSTASTITKAGLDNSSAKLVEPGTILLAMYGSIGKVGIAGCRMATNQAIAFFVPNPAIVSQKYFFYFLMSQRPLFTRSQRGSTQQNISQTVLKPWRIPVAPHCEQQLIVQMLEEQFSRLEIISKAGIMVEKVEELRISLLHSAFVGELSRKWRESRSA